MVFESPRQMRKLNSIRSCHETPESTTPSRPILSIPTSKVKAQSGESKTGRQPQIHSIPSLTNTSLPPILSFPYPLDFRLLLLLPCLLGVRFRLLCFLGFLLLVRRFRSWLSRRLGLRLGGWGTRLWRIGGRLVWERCGSV